MNEPIGVVIQGGSGFGAGELLRYFTHHPAVQIIGVVSSSQAGEPVSSVHPHLQGFYPGLRFEKSVPWERFAQCKRRVLFLALPHGHSAPALRELQTQAYKDTRVIDLSADFRLTDETAHRRTYPDVAFDAELRTTFTYGLTELNREQIRSAMRIANPGCLATACILAAQPLVSTFQSQILGSLIFDAKTGTSGAGRAPQDSMHHPQRHGNFEAYKVLAHRHEPEMRQALTLHGADALPTMFVPHLLPISRGIFATMYAQLRTTIKLEELRARYESTYKTSRFIRFRQGSPRLHDVVGTNFCDISVAVRDNQVVVLAALDNLGKGMASQAIQNMNVMFGLDETAGLLQPALGIS